MVDTAHCHCSPIHGKCRDTPRYYRPLSRRLDRCDRVIQNESRDPFGGNVYYVTMQMTFFTRKFRNGERNLHCDVVHITTKWVSSLTLDCNGVFAIKTYDVDYPLLRMLPAHNNHLISTCKQLDTACHQWNNSDFFTFPKRLMPECQVHVYGCINKAGEGASNGKKIFQIKNATKFPAKRELPIKWFHTIGTVIN